MLLFKKLGKTIPNFYNRIFLQVRQLLLKNWDIFSYLLNKLSDFGFYLLIISPLILYLYKWDKSIQEQTPLIKKCHLQTNFFFWGKTKMPKIALTSYSWTFFGADDETRTRDLILTKDVRYHLCHISIFGRGRRTWTLGTWFWRPLLYQLSYTPISVSHKNGGPSGIRTRDRPVMSRLL